MPRKVAPACPEPHERAPHLERKQKLKMARSSHRYVRGATESFYDWLGEQGPKFLPEGPPVWICGDCHVGNLGPLASAAGRVEVQIRDLDQTVIGNPAHDLVRLGLSFASAMRGSDLPGVATAKMLEAMVDGYEKAFQPDFCEDEDLETPESVKAAIRQSATASWKTLAADRIDGPSPTIPLGKRYWPISERERDEIFALFATAEMRRLATLLRSRADDSDVEIMDAAYWMKGCSSLGRLRFAVLLSVTAEGRRGKRRDYCLMDIKEATPSAAPNAKDADMPEDFGERVVEGARLLSPNLGRRMRPARLLERPVFIRELMPQDLKLEIAQLTRDEAIRAATYLAAVVGKAHSRQMDAAARTEWQRMLAHSRSSSLDAPHWLWRSVVGLMVAHEEAYLEHCRAFALGAESEVEFSREAA